MTSGLRLRKSGSEQEFVNTCVFAGFLSDRLLGPPMPPHLLHVRCRQCFPTFCGSFHVRTWPQLLSGHNPLKGRLKGARPVQNSSSQTASLFVRRHRGGPQILRLEIASWTSPSESEPYACLAALFRVTSPGKRNPSEGFGSVTIASDQVVIPTAHGRKPILKTSKPLDSETHANCILLRILVQSHIFKGDG